MNKPILDPCCGGRMMYFDKESPLVEFCDIREIDTTLCDGRRFKVAPDTVADFRNLPFDDESYNLILFDPPHLKNAGEKSWLAIKYGTLPRHDYAEYIKDGFNECWRVLRKGGTMVFKWNEEQIPVREILKALPVKPVWGSRMNGSKTGFYMFYKE